MEKAWQSRNTERHREVICPELMDDMSKAMFLVMEGNQDDAVNKVMAKYDLKQKAVDMEAARRLSVEDLEKIIQEKKQALQISTTNFTPV